MVATRRTAGERLVGGLEEVGKLGKRAAAEVTGMSEGTVSKKAKASQHLSKRPRAAKYRLRCYTPASRSECC